MAARLTKRGAIALLEFVQELANVALTDTAFDDPEFLLSIALLWVEEATDIINDIHSGEL